jgi:trk system potassium uptake protein
LKVLVIGAGRVGSALASKLVEDGHEISMVDKDLVKLRHFEDRGFPAQLHVGLGFDIETLERAGAAKANVIVSATNSDNANLLSVQLGRVKFGIERLVARVRDPKKAEFFEKEFNMEVVCETIPAIEELSEAVEGMEARSIKESRDILGEGS